MENNVRLCPICSDKKFDCIVRFDSGVVVKCRNCSFVYSGNVNSVTENDNHESHDSIMQHTAQLSFRHIAIYNKLQEYFRDARVVNIIEIGSGGGALGKLLTNNIMSIHYNYTGFEPSNSRYHFTKKMGLNVINDYFAADKIASQVDAIVIDNVLEHVVNPKDLIIEVSKSLKPGGIVFVIVPNLNDIRRFHPVWKKRHYWQPKHHLNYFKRSDLVRLFTPLGIDVRDLEIQRNNSLRFLVNAILNRIGLHLLGLYCYGVKR